jgi:2-isopropylmalate synthase
MRDRTTYEIMDPKELGIGESKLVLGKHSGRNAFIKRIVEMGFSMKDEEIEKAFRTFKVLADKKKEISDKDIESLISDEIYVTPETYKLDFLKISSGTTIKPVAEIKLIFKAKKIKAKVSGDGPVDAVYRAVDKLVKKPDKLVDYIIQAITGGTDALGEVAVRIKDSKENIFSGHGSDTDIIIASAKAYINAINKMVS